MKRIFEFAMLHISALTLVKFFFGILITQGVTAMLVYTALTTDLQRTWLLFAIVVCMIGFLVALWFTSIVDGANKHALGKAKERFFREREKIRVQAEKARVKEARVSQRRVEKAKSSGLSAGTSLKTGAIVGGAVGLGVAVMTQFVTLGLLMATSAGGLALGYTVRARQEKIVRGKQLPATEKPVAVIEAGRVTPILEARPKRPNRERGAS